MTRLLLFLLFSIPLSLSAQQSFQLAGKVTDEAGKPLAYAAVSLDETRYGALTNSKGYYRIRVPAGNYALTAAYLGYESWHQAVNVQADVTYDISLKTEHLELSEVFITSDGKDPAYGLIKLAIKNKKANRRPFKTYQYKSYTKTSFAFRRGFDADSIGRELAKKFGSKEEKNDTTESESEDESRILYLSENLSKVTIQTPAKVKEEILYSRVSGAKGQFSFLGNLVNRFDPYEDKTVMRTIAERGLVSPISSSAFFFYKYKLLGTQKENGMQFYKIEFHPKRKNDPAYTGVIYLADSSYAVKKLDMYITREQSIELLDTLKIRQEYMEVKGKWVSFKSQLGFALDFNLFGAVFPLEGTSASLLSEYNTEPALSKNFFGREIMSIEDSATTTDEHFWEQARPVPLSIEELEDYHVKDSLEAYYNSPEYLDSMSLATHKSFKPIKALLTGHTFRDFRKKSSTQILAPLSGVFFNAIEGWGLELGVKREWRAKKKGRHKVSPKIRYGFGNKKLSWKLRSENWATGKARPYTYSVFGDYSTQFSRFQQVTADANLTWAITLYDHINNVRLYQKRFAELGHSRNISNGLRLRGDLRYEDRTALQNSSEFSLFHKDRLYAPNFQIPAHQALTGKLKLSYQPFNKYISTPTGRINLGSAWPKITAIYQHAFSINDSSSSFSNIKVSLKNTTSLGLLGNTSWRISAGKFLDQSKVYTPDLFHFKGNENLTRTEKFDEFFLMPYYSTSSTLPFVEGHIEHAFGGFLFNKVPGLRKLKLKEYLGAHVLMQENKGTYLELNAGVEMKIMRLLPIRFDFNILLQGGETQAKQWGFKLLLLPGFKSDGQSVSVSL